MILNDDTSHGAAELWSKWIGHLAGKEDLRLLEIGSWEGASARWFLKNILTGANSDIVCVDTFEGGGGMPEVPNESLYDKFMENMQAWVPRVHVIRQRSQVALRAINRNIFDVAFIDGSHRVEDVLTDSVLTWCVVKYGGYIIWDDYGLKMGDPKLEPRFAIDTFLSIFKGEYEVIGMDYQVCIKKNEITGPNRT